MARIPTPVAPGAADEQAAPSDAAEAAAAPADPVNEPDAETVTVDLGEMVQVRVLRDHLEYEANTVAFVPERLIDESWADPNPEAVAYVRSLEG